MLLVVADQDAMRRVERQAEPVLTQKLAAQLLDAEVARLPEIENKRFLVGEHLLLRQVARTAALVLQSSDAIRPDIGATTSAASAAKCRSVGRPFPASPSCS